MNTNILVGADPEIFAKKDGEFVSAFGMIPGTKHDPFFVMDGAVQVDGMALEFNIVPAASEEEFTVNINSVMKQLKEMVPDVEFGIVPVADFDEIYMLNQPDEAKELGCDPDFNAWENSQRNRKPDVDRPMRTASGHVHIGWTQGMVPWAKDHILDCEAVIKQLDFFLGLPSLLFDSDTRRREMYGKAGCFRPKSYGAEYRVLSNKWLASQELIKWVYRNTVDGYNRLFNGAPLCYEYGDIQKIINTSDVQAAKKIIEAAKIEVPNV